MTTVRVGLTLLCLSASVAAAQTKPTRVYVGVVEMSCPVCSTPLRAALEKIPGVKFEFVDDFGETSFGALEIADIAKADVGAIAKTLSQTDTPHKKDSPSGLILLPIKEEETTNGQLHEALAKVKGVELNRTFNGDARVWIRLDHSGQAKLSEISKALKDAGIRVAFDKAKQ